jgi:hypothetical protein
MGEDDGIHEVHAIKHAHLARRAAEKFLAGDQHETAPMPLDDFVCRRCPKATRRCGASLPQRTTSSRVTTRLCWRATPPLPRGSTASPHGSTRTRGRLQTAVDSRFAGCVRL